MNAYFKANEMFFLSSAAEADLPARFPHARAVIGPLGEKLTLDLLPPPGCNRWTARRKAEVVAAVTGGLLTAAEARARYNLSPEEFAGWKHAVDRAGLPGLRATQAQYYKKLHEQPRP